jgi:hypothetical protein
VVSGEIKRRKMFQVAAVYAVVAWLLTQIVATIQRPLHLPDWFDTAVIVLSAVGFPIALIISWAFDVTPEGIVRDEGRATARPGSARPTRNRVRPGRALGNRRRVDRLSRARFLDANSGASAGTVSVAVLPFVNLSADPEQDFFSDGMTEEISSALGKVQGLAVVGRTSAFQFKGEAEDLRDIGP